MPAAALEMVSRVRKSGRHLLELVNDVLGISRLEAGKVQIECVDFDLAGNVRDTMTAVEPRRGGKDRAGPGRAAAASRCVTDPRACGRSSSTSPRTP